MSKKSYSRAKGRSETSRFLALPYSVTEHENFIRLSAYGTKLLVDIGRQFSGANNGDLCATWKFMNARGWKSKETLNDSLRELEHYGFIVMTQQGDRKRPTLYALSWNLIDRASSEFRSLVNTTPSSWKNEKEAFVRPSSKRISKQSVTRNAVHVGTECVAKVVEMRKVQ